MSQLPRPLRPTILWCIMGRSELPQHLTAWHFSVMERIAFSALGAWSVAEWKREVSCWDSRNMLFLFPYTFALSPPSCWVPLISTGAKGQTHSHSPWALFPGGRKDHWSPRFCMALCPSSANNQFRSQSPLCSSYEKIPSLYEYFPEMWGKLLY